jgi:hypothetical protein
MSSPSHSIAYQTTTTTTTTCIYIYFISFPQNKQKPSQAVAFASLPRFSHSNDISLLFSSSREDNTDYATGLIFVATFIMSFFVVWGLMLLLLKCRRCSGEPDKVEGRGRLLAGYPYEKESKQSHCGRFLVLISSLSIIISAVLLITQGLTELQYTTDTITHTNTEIINIHDESIRILNNLVDVSSRAIPIRQELITSFLQQGGEVVVCPLNSQSQTETRIRDVADDTLRGLQQLDDFDVVVGGNLTQVQIALQQLDVTTRQVTQVTSNLEEFTTTNSAVVIAIIMIPYFVIPAFIIVAVWMGWYDVFLERYYTFMTWFMVPLMIVLTIFAFVAASWTALALQGNSDFCANPNPTTAIQNILQQYPSIQPGTSFYYDVINFYITQCDASTTTGSGDGGSTTSSDHLDNPWMFMQTYNEALVRSLRNYVCT